MPAQVATLPAHSDDARPRMIFSNAWQHWETLRILTDSWALDAGSGSCQDVPVDSAGTRDVLKYCFEGFGRTEHSNQEVEDVIMIAAGKRPRSLACSLQMGGGCAP
jgi:hypothetical protein